MKPFFRRVIPALAATLLLAAAATAQPAPNAYDYKMGEKQGREAFYQAAFAYISDPGPDASELAEARLLMDVVFAATAFPNEEVRAEAERLLLLNHTQRLEAAYLLRTMGDDETAGERLQFHLAEIIDDRGGAKAQPVMRLLRQAVLIRGGGFMGDSKLVSLALLYAEAAGDFELHGLLVRLARTSIANAPDSKNNVVLEVCLDHAAPLLNRLQRLHAVGQPEQTAIAERLILSLLPEAQRRAPETRRLALSIYLKERKFEKVAAEADAMLADDAFADERARLLVHKGYASAVGQDFDTAKAACRQVLDELPDDPWAPVAEQWLAAVEGWRENIDRIASSVGKSIGGLQRAERIEATLVVTGDDDGSGQQLVVSLGPNGSAHLRVSGPEGPFMLYARDVDGLRYHNAAEDVIRRYAVPGPAFQPRLSLERNATGGFAFGFSGGFSSTADTAGSTAAALLNSRFFNTGDGITELLWDFMFRVGYFPTIEQDAGGEKHVWVRPAYDWPRMERITFRYDAEERLTGIDFGGQFRIENLRFGSADAFGPPTFNWPDLPVEEHAEADVATLTAMMGQVMQVFLPLMEGKSNPVE